MSLSTNETENKPERIDFFTLLHNWIEDNKSEFFDSRYRVINAFAFNAFWQHYKEEIKNANQGIVDDKKKAREITSEYLKSQWDLHIGYTFARLALEDLRQRLQYHPDAQPQINHILQAACGHSSPLYIAVLSHWLWQCKRKIYGLPVVNHLFLMLYEPVGGSGKTTLIKTMLQPLKDYCLDWDLSKLSDERNHMALHHNFLVVFDEMGKPERISADFLKHLITAENIDVRKFNTQIIVHLSQQCSFIGSSNKQLDTLIIDSGSMRRFFQFECLPKMDWDAVNRIDALALWQSIDESRENGYLVDEVLLDCQSEQRELTTPDVVEIFLEEMQVLPVSACYTTKITNERLYLYFHAFAKRAGINSPPTRMAFINRIKQLKAIKGSKGKRMRVINDAHNLKELDEYCERWRWDED